jgi:iron(III) transport system permease protein
MSIIATAPGLQQALLHGRWWLLPLALPLLAPLLLLGRRQDSPAAANLLIACGMAGTLYVIAQGFLVIHRGWGFEFLNAWLGPLEVRQFGMGTGAALTLLAFLMLFAQGVAARGAVNGDRFVVGSITLIVALVAAFIFFPVARILTGAIQAPDGSLAPQVFLDRFVDTRIWGLDCVLGGTRCGSAWNTLFLAIMTGISTTTLGLAFALVVARTQLRGRWAAADADRSCRSSRRPS